MSVIILTARGDDIDRIDSKCPTRLVGFALVDRGNCWNAKMKLVEIEMGMGDESSDSGDTRPDLSQPVHIEDVPRGRFRLDVSDLELPQALTEMLDERPLPGEGAESGDQFGKYILLERMAEGGMAEVWRAHGPEGRCVVKRVREDLRDRADVMTMFGDEIRLAMRLDHPHVVRALGTGQIDGTEFLALEHLEGSNLALFARQKLGWQTVVAIAIDVARALAYVHPLGVIHRDVCPENVLVTPTGAKLLDFGIARYDDRDHQTRLGELKGRLDRMAPEQRRGEAIDGRADLYALGRTIEAALDPAGGP